MKEKIKNLNIYFQISILCSFLTILISLISLFCLIWKMWGIPVGTFLGGALGCASIFFLGKGENIDNDKKKVILSIVNLVVRYALLVGLTILCVFLKAKKSIVLFNPLAFLLMYLITSLIFVIALSIKEKKEKND